MHNIKILVYKFIGSLKTDKVVYQKHLSDITGETTHEQIVASPAFDPQGHFTNKDIPSYFNDSQNPGLKNSFQIALGKVDPRLRMGKAYFTTMIKVFFESGAGKGFQKKIDRFKAREKERDVQKNLPAEWPSFHSVEGFRALKARQGRR